MISLQIDTETRNTSSEHLFVRSQSQLALASPQATGLKLTQQQVKLAFGKQMVQDVLDNDVVAIVPSYAEPAKTLRSRREQMGLTTTQLAKASAVPEQTICDAETPGKIVRIQDLNLICQPLALDESTLGWTHAHSNEELGVRLRKLTEDRDISVFSPTTITTLAEAAWVVAKQASLSAQVGVKVHHLMAAGHKHDANYGYPAWEWGYKLANKTRKLLGLADGSPIPSMRSLVEETLGIPTVQVKLSKQFAGATLANGPSRGIVVNEQGRNSDVAIRRMTLCHELGHLLWDPDSCLDRLIADEYEQIEGRDWEATRHDPVEIRANAFAVAFLAPPEAVKDIASTRSDEDAVAEIASRFGISILASRYHVKNICKREAVANHIPIVDYSGWMRAENLTIHHLPGMPSVPITRRGMFSGIVARAYLKRLITIESAALFLQCPVAEIEAGAQSVAEVWKL